MLLAIEGGQSSSDGGDVVEEDHGHPDGDDGIQDPLFLRGEPDTHDDRNFDWEPSNSTSHSPERKHGGGSASVHFINQMLKRNVGKLRL